MIQDYIIINKAYIQKRIEELKPNLIISDKNEKEISTLEQILSQSIPLIPEIEKAFDTGKTAYITSKYIHDTPSFEDQKKDHISNLKLDI